MKYLFTFSFTLLSSMFVFGQVNEYFDFSSWNVDVTNVTHTDNFNSVNSDMSFRSTPYAGVGYTMYSRELISYSGSNMIDATPFDPNTVDNNGSTHARLFVQNSSIGAPQVWVTIYFDRPATSFYAEFEGHATEARVLVELYDTSGNKIVWHNLSPVTMMSTFSKRDYGFIIDPSSNPIDSIRFMAETNDADGEIFSMDNISMTLTAAPADPIPTLSEWSVLILGLCLIIFSIVGLRSTVSQTGSL